MKIVIIGSGNLATRMSLSLFGLQDIHIVQVYSHTKEHAIALASRLACDATDNPKEVIDDADLYLFSLKDTALESVISSIRPNKGLWVHTAGSMPMNVFAGYTSRYGVLYPLQTFSKNREISFDDIPFFWESFHETDGIILKNLACRLSKRVRQLSSEKRKFLHLAAVFACNFTNHMYVLSAEILRKAELPEDDLLPLINETAAKVNDMPALDAQTGPALRYDENVIGKHLALLADTPELQNIYESLSKSIHQYAEK